MIGLGNPGKLYAGTRHNAGFQVIDFLSEKISIQLKKPFFSPCMRGKGEYKNGRIILAKPLTYMNRSGLVVPGLLRYAKTDCSGLLIICDTLDLEPGMCRLKTRGSSAGHRGLASVINFCGTQNFMRLYIGIGRPGDNNIIEYVLNKPPNEEKEKIDHAVKIATSGVLMLLEKSAGEVMNKINTTGKRNTKE